MTKLRSDLIRLAYCNVEIRSAVLPMLQSREGSIPYFDDAAYYFDELKAFSRRYDLPGWDFLGLYHGSLSGVLQRGTIDVIPHGEDMVARYTNGPFEYYVVYTYQDASEDGIDAPYVQATPVLRYMVREDAWNVIYRGGLGGIYRLPGGENALWDILKRNVKAYERDARLKLK